MKQRKPKAIYKEWIADILCCFKKKEHYRIETRNIQRKEIFSLWNKWNEIFSKRTQCWRPRVKDNFIACTGINFNFIDVLTQIWMASYLFASDLCSFFLFYIFNSLCHTQKMPKIRRVKQKNEDLPPSIDLCTRNSCPPSERKTSEKDEDWKGWPRSSLGRHSGTLTGVQLLWPRSSLRRHSGTLTGVQLLSPLTFTVSPTTLTWNL